MILHWITVLALFVIFISAWLHDVHEKLKFVSEYSE